MAPKLSLEARMTILELLRRGWSRLAIAGTLGVTEGAVRYHERRHGQGRKDGRVGRQRHRAESVAEQIEAWLAVDASRRERLNLAALHEHLVAEHGYSGSRRSVQRYCRAHYPAPRVRARRRVETPPGAQGQADWAVFGGVVIGGETVELLAFHLQLSWSRFGALVWSRRRDQLSWQEAHLKSFRRLGGVPACVRVDNEKTAVVRGAGSWGERNPAYRRFAERARFHIDVCPPRAPEAKGKVERRIRDHRRWLDPRSRAWDSLEELQVWSDEQLQSNAQRRRCPATGGSVAEAWEQERRLLGELQPLPHPFDVVVVRRVAPDCTVRFEGRTYSVPFHLLGREVEVFGCADEVEIHHQGARMASHRRYTEERIVIDATHYEGPASEDVLPPAPLGRMGRRLAELTALAPEQRPLDLYAALAEVAR
jgi:transposase